MREMEPKGISLGRRGGGGVNNGKTGDGFIDRSKVRILLCDNDSKGSGEVFTLLCKCSYQVISVKSPRQVIDALNADGPNIDLILSEVDLPMAKGLKMLKYIMRKELQRIPVISKLVMSAQDEVTFVVKCLRLGAADYLVKPLRTNELLNLWTHVWRRRRMLGLAEKKIMICEFDLVPSDLSDVNTNSTMFSDDTDEKSRKSAHPEMSVSTHWRDEINVMLAPGSADTQLVRLSNARSNVPETNDHLRGEFISAPKKSELKIGQSSAFFTYVKSSMSMRTAPHVSVSVSETAPPSRIHKEPGAHAGEVDGLATSLTDQNVQQHLCIEKHGVGNSRGHYHSQTLENLPRIDDGPSSNSFPDSLSLDESSTPPLPTECSPQMNSKMEEFPKEQMQQLRNNSHSHPNISGYNPLPPYPYYLQGAINQVMMSSSSMVHNHGNTAMLPQYNHGPPHYPPHHMTSFPYYPVNLCLRPGLMGPTVHPWSSYGSSSSNEGKLKTVDRREAALLKFRQKRKERCFDKKIRYVNRKKLAERRPRIRGQFVRKVNGINVDLNGHPTSVDFDDENEDEEEDQTCRDYSPE
ncbi:two-component response regulator-like APRR1 isoform X1 [Cynara cardunculus var. scolymus]|uniref:two-component response regulator-like APRR1 isoform X1 n=1 Tax=Cynara cardunculus var. scolymus TaxID=59895 RepID=UPI000D625990|nr:two-component response regulator-like APRR1 isoform X1 [Cynara cardunculus var. scolymus]